MVKLRIGDRIYNRGDMANLSHWGTVRRVDRTRWGVHYMIQPDPDDGTERDPYWIYAASVSAVDEGHGGTRIVTEAAYKARRAAQLAALQHEHGGRQG